jgi:hypothetical protein
MKRHHYFFAYLALLGALLLASTFAIRANAATTCNIFNGCTGTSTTTGLRPGARRRQEWRV